MQCKSAGKRSALESKSNEGVDAKQTWTSTCKFHKEAGINSPATQRMYLYSEMKKEGSISSRAEGWKAIVFHRVEESCTTCVRLPASSGFIIFFCAVQPEKEEGQCIERVLGDRRTLGSTLVACMWVDLDPTSSLSQLGQADCQSAVWTRDH